MLLGDKSNALMLAVKIRQTLHEQRRKTSPNTNFLTFCAEVTQTAAVQFRFRLQRQTITVTQAVITAVKSAVSSWPFSIATSINILWDYWAMIVRDRPLLWASLNSASMFLSPLQRLDVVVIKPNSTRGRNVFCFCKGKPNPSVKVENVMWWPAVRKRIR